MFFKNKTGRYEYHRVRCKPSGIIELGRKVTQLGNNVTERNSKIHDQNKFSCGREDNWKRPA